ncbi:MAG: bile acid:sodium symporter family protein [Candidatus Riflebacteria bacterium]|nr:bile acid:sodium symporter family protein [Candidatus Riflebacteria bacterium]
MRPAGERLYLYLNSRMIFFMLFAMLCGWLGGESLGGMRGAVPWMFGYMTFVTALKTSWKDLGIIFRKPLPLISIVVLQHLLMPVIASICSNLLFPGRQELILGYILMAALPIGITAVIWAGLGKGDVALSLTAATVDTLLSPLIVPAILLIFAGQQATIDYNSMIRGLIFMIVLPSVLGLTINDLSRGSFYNRNIRYLGLPSFFCMCLVITINVGMAQKSAAEMFSKAPLIVLLTMCMTLTGFVTGYLLARIFGFKTGALITSTFCAGIRNTSVGLVLAIGHFPVESSIPVLVAMMFQQPLAAVAQRLLTSPPEPAAGAAKA